MSYVLELTLLEFKRKVQATISGLSMHSTGSEAIFESTGDLIVNALPRGTYVAGRKAKRG